MDDLSSLFSSMDTSNDLVDKMAKLLDRQTDHKLPPNLLLGFMGMFNLMSIMSVVKNNLDSGVREVKGIEENNSESKTCEQSLVDGLSSMISSGSNSQPDLMGMLGNVASKKKLNPGLLLSLFSMLNNNQANGQVNHVKEDRKAAEEVITTLSQGDDRENKPSPVKDEVELKYDRKKSSADKS